MRANDRLHHPTRALVDRLMARWFNGHRFDWLDVGVIGMVDYERLRPRMAFRFTGADISEATVADARSYLARPGDRVLVWDVGEPPPQALIGSADLVTLRHVLNHCPYYEAPLEHIAQVLRPGGIVVIVLHLALVEGGDRLERHERWGVEGEVIGNRYDRETFFTWLGRLYEPIIWVRVDDGRKPNDVIVGRKAPITSTGRAAPPALRLWMPSGRRGTLARWLATRRFDAFVAPIESRIGHG